MTAPRVEGVDVSRWQVSMDWAVLRSQCRRFAYIQATNTKRGDDPLYQPFMAGAVATGVLAGAYHFVYPQGVDGVAADPVAHAQYFHRLVTPQLGDGYLRPMLDIEQGDSLGKDALSQWVMAYSVEFERLSGLIPIIYTNSNYAWNFLNEAVAQRHDLWLARPDPGFHSQTGDPPKPNPWNHPNWYGSWNRPPTGPPTHDVWTLWQYGQGPGGLYGAGSDKIDLNVFHGDLDAFQRRCMIRR